MFRDRHRLLNCHNALRRILHKCGLIFLLFFVTNMMNQSLEMPKFQSSWQSASRLGKRLGSARADVRSPRRWSPDWRSWPRQQQQQHRFLALCARSRIQPAMAARKPVDECGARGEEAAAAAAAAAKTIAPAQAGNFST
jgi:hypothetical protein